MAAACLPSSSCWNLTGRFQNLSLSPAAAHGAAFARPLSFSANVSLNISFKGAVSVNPLQRPHRRLSIVCAEAPTKKADSAAKRHRQSEKRRIYHKAKKSEVRTRMKKALEELEALRKKRDAQQDEVLPVEKLIAEAYSVIDKAVKAGTLHKNTGARRKSRLARRKRAVAIHHGWYVPAPTPDPAPATV